MSEAVNKANAILNSENPIIIVTLGTSWVYELNVDLDKLSGYKLDFSKLSMTVNGETVTYVPAGTVNGSEAIYYHVKATIGGEEVTANERNDFREIAIFKSGVTL